MSAWLFSVGAGESIMMRVANRIRTNGRSASVRGEPVWDLARLYPVQGSWTEEEYLGLSERTNRLIELSNGFLEFPPMPTVSHQTISFFLGKLLDAFVSSETEGVVLFSPLPVRLIPGNYREPDIVYLRPKRLEGDPDYPQGADLVVEI